MTKLSGRYSISILLRTLQYFLFDEKNSKICYSVIIFFLGFSKGDGGDVMFD